MDSGLLITQGAVQRRRPRGRQRGWHAALPGCPSLECRHQRLANPAGAIVAAHEHLGRRHARSRGLVDWSTSERVSQHGMCVRVALVADEATAILRAWGDAIVTGMARINANDLVLIVVR